MDMEEPLKTGFGFVILYLTTDGRHIMPYPHGQTGIGLPSTE
jgi:hypothetical protein